MSRKKEYTVGIVLILIGALFLLSNLVEVSIMVNFLIIVGTAFLIGYYSKRNTGYLIAGTVILAIGVSEIVDTYILLPVDISGFTVLVALGIAFLILYSTKNIRGFIYPGCFLIAIGLFTLINDSYGYDIPWAFMAFIGIAFYFIYLIETRRDGQKWPLIPGTILIGFSGLLYLILEDVIDVSLWKTLSYIWPALLILAGIKIIYNNTRIKK